MPISTLFRRCTRSCEPATSRRFRRRPPSTSCTAARLTVAFPVFYLPPSGTPLEGAGPRRLRTPSQTVRQPRAPAADDWNSILADAHEVAVNVVGRNVAMA